MENEKQYAWTFHRDFLAQEKRQCLNRKLLEYESNNQNQNPLEYESDNQNEQYPRQL